MSTTKNAGRIGFVLEGAYDPSKTYKPLSVVGYNGNTYAAKVENRGHLPTDSTYWQQLTDNIAGALLMASDGVSVQTITANQFKVTYDSGQVYNITISGTNLIIT